jgi:hypothetical protein
MKVTEVRYDLESTINLGDFENVKPGYGITLEIEDGDDPDKVRAFAKRKVTEWMNAEYDEIQVELKQIGVKRTKK